MGNEGGKEARQMELGPVSVRMLGEFSVRQGGREISDNDNRSWKIWLLLAYVIYSHDRVVSPEEMVALLWGPEARGANPLNALKTMLYRVRACLDQLGDNAGHRLILRKDGGYAWNNDVPFTLDVEEFDRLCRAGNDTRDPEERLALWMRALPLYRGRFLAKLSSEPWVVPIAAYFHDVYVRTVLDTLPLLQRRERWADAARLCTWAVEVEPYREELYRCLMTALIRSGDQRAAAEAYEKMSERLLDKLGLMPSDELRELYHEALRFVDRGTMSTASLLDSLREPSGPGGAMICDYGFFRAVYHSVARMVERSGAAVHLALISITSAGEDELSRRSLDRVVENLKALIRAQLRRGDAASRCSVSQFVLLLPQANYEDSCMICDRIVRAFGRQYPHSPAALAVSIVPLEPNM